jgi:formylglycine-generating enzyme required for sulfatase activity
MAERSELILTLAPGVNMILVWVEAGEFWMGSDGARDPGAYEDELPQHCVYLDGYWIGKTPVTNAQYGAFVLAIQHGPPSHWTGTAIPPGKDEHPVVNICWDEAVEFCAWASQVTGRRLAQPTEAQWEKAARGVDGRIYPWGDAPPDANHCNFGRIILDTTPVGQYSPKGDSPYGCTDMAGQVWEWCSDGYDKGAYTRRSGMETRNPIGSPAAEKRCVRGGSWNVYARGVRAALRNKYKPAGKNILLGFRCVYNS